jgi:hypothetical protein
MVDAVTSGGQLYGNKASTPLLGGRKFGEADAALRTAVIFNLN